MDQLDAHEKSRNIHTHPIKNIYVDFVYNIKQVCISTLTALGILQIILHNICMSILATRIIFITTS